MTQQARWFQVTDFISGSRRTAGFEVALRKKGACFDYALHHFNASDVTILKEAWTNLWWEADQ
jgi:hypothetical protein